MGIFFTKIQQSGPQKLTLILKYIKFYSWWDLSSQDYCACALFKFLLF